MQEFAVRVGIKRVQENGGDVMSRYVEAVMAVI